MCRAPNLRNIVGDTSPTSVASLQNLQLTKTAAGDAETAFEVTSEREDFDVDLRVPSPSGDLPGRVVVAKGADANAARRSALTESYDARAGTAMPTSAIARRPDVISRDLQ